MKEAILNFINNLSAGTNWPWTCVHLIRESSAH